MYNKIAQIILNSGKGHGVNVVYISQPDAIKEQQAGKIFLLASLDSKKHRDQEIIDFIISNIEDYYYNDEKIALKDKIEGLKIENIFEAALSKTNKSLNDFLEGRKDFLDLSNTHITLGIIYENKLHFSNYGNNKAFLIFPKDNQYQLINIESSASDVEDEGDKKRSHSKLFSSIISGEIPERSYFLFVNETIPEYISDEELTEIITKLPPVVAAEQIKNTLNKLNSYVPFLGIIIKNTVGNVEIREEVEVSSAQASISVLNHTEQKTEQMLSPSGLIDLRKIAKKSKDILVGIKGNRVKKEKKKEIKEEIKVEPKKHISRSKSKKLNIPRPDSFLIKDKIVFKKKSRHILKNARDYLLIIPYLVKILISGIKTLNRKKKILLSLLVVVIIIFSVSLMVTNTEHNSKVVNEEFNQLVNKVEEKEALIDSHLLYDDNDGARIVLKDTKQLLKSFPLENKAQKKKYKELKDKLDAQEIKIEKIIPVDTLETALTINNIGVNNIILGDHAIYLSNNHNIYKVTNGEINDKVDVKASQLLHPYYYKDSIYYWDNGKIVKFNTKDNSQKVLDIEGIKPDEIKNFSIYINKLYLLNTKENQIQRYRLVNNKYDKPINWLKDDVDLSSASALGIDGSIYVLNDDGNVIALYGGQKKKYKENTILPKMIKANKLIVGEKYLYILDPMSNRMAILLKKDGSIEKQYKFNNITIRDFAVNDKEGIVYILSPNKLYKMKID